MKWFNNAPIGLKIFLSVAAIMVIAFGTIGSLSYARVSALLQHDIQTSYRNTANNSANLVASQIDKLKATIEAIAERPDIRSMNFAVQQPALLREAQRIGCLRFSIVDLQGNLLTTDRKKGANIADKPYFLRAKQGETAVGGPSLAKVDGKLILVVTTPIRDAGNRVAAVLNAVFDGKILTDILRQIRVADGKGSVYMVDREGTLIANPQHYELVLKQDNSLKNAARDPRLGAMAGYTRKMIAGGTGFGSYFFNGITKFIAYNPVPGMDWFLAVTVPRDHIFKPIDDLTWQLPAMFLIALGFILAVIYVVTRSYVSRPIAGLMAAAEKLALGNVNVDLQAGSGDEIGRLIQAFNKMIANIREGAQAARGIAAGDLAVTIRPKSDDDLQALSMQQMIDSLRELIDETQRLTGAAAAGELAVRGDNAKFQGAFGEIVLGINRMLDAMVGPLNTAADYVERIGQGEIPPPLTGEYQGEYNQLKISINACIKGLGALTESNAVLQQMTLNDYTRQIAGDYHGVYGEIAQAVNKVLAKLIGIQQTAAHMAQGDFGDLEALQKVGRLSEHDELTPSLTRMMGTILAMVHESVRLSEAAAAGELNVRGDIGKFGGEYRRVIEGFNATLDAVVGPLTEAGAVLAKIAVNDYTQEMKGEYQGVLREFAAQINTTRARLLSVQDVFVRLAQGDISRLEEFRAVGRRSENDRMMPSATAMMEAIDALIQESNMLAGAAARGELKVRGDAAKFSGKYQEIVIGLNGALDAMALPITEASAVLDEMARGSLESVMAGEYQGEYARIKESLNGALAAFNQVLGEINSAAGQVAAASRHVSAGSQALSQGATEQAATVEELSASVAEIAAQTKQNSLRAGQANELANLTKNDAIQGNAQMEEMLAAMQGINEAGTNISKIIKVIDEIAFQTNILALNAAVEAARAGQHGKGFAVVAEEVRNLAGRSAKAAKETTELIEGSLRKAADGTRIASRTAESLDKIVTAVTRAADLVQEIATASNEQATGIAQINQGINQVAQVTQTNTATSEESASASEELSSQAEHLKEMVGRFKLKRQAVEAAQDREATDRITVPDRMGSIGFGKY